MHQGELAGYPVVGVKVTLVDGSYHTVDSSEMAFKIAGSMAFKKAYAEADPVLLEPIMGVEITVPEETVGDVIGDLNSRRGRAARDGSGRRLDHDPRRGADGRDARLRARPDVDDRRPRRLRDEPRCATRRCRRTSPSRLHRRGDQGEGARQGLTRLALEPLVLALEVERQRAHPEPLRALGRRSIGSSTRAGPGRRRARGLRAPGRAGLLVAVRPQAVVQEPGGHPGRAAPVAGHGPAGAALERRLARRRSTGSARAARTRARRAGGRRAARRSDGGASAGPAARGSTRSRPAGARPTAASGRRTGRRARPSSARAAPARPGGPRARWRSSPDRLASARSDSCVRDVGEHLLHAEPPCGRATRAGRSAPAAAATGTAGSRAGRPPRGPSARRTWARRRARTRRAR